MQPPPPITRALLIACTVLLFLCHIPALQFTMIEWVALTPVRSGFFFGYQMLTYAFVHLSVFQWLFNMMALYFFGTELENLWGERRYIQFLLATILMAALLYVVLTFLLGIAAPLMGFNAAIFGMLVAFGVLFPNRLISLYFVAQVRMRTAVLIFAGILVFQMLGDMGSLSGAWIEGLSQFAGALGGYLMILYWRWRPPSFKRKKSPPNIRRVH